MTRKFFIISNPYAGKGMAQAALTQLTKRLDVYDFFYAVFITPKSEILDEFIEENLFTDATDVVVIGGDGTINATLNAIGEKQMVLSFIPVGTCNDFVKTINIGSDLKEQIETIVMGTERTIDTGACNGRRFINGVGVGFDGQIIHDTMNKKSLFRGYTNYMLHVLKILGTYRSKKFSIELDGQKLDMQLILMAIHNGTTFGGGFKLNPESKIDDGLLNICTIGRITFLRRALHLGRLNFGTHGRLPEVNFFNAKRIKISENPSLKCHIDGEYFGTPPFEISILEEDQKIRVQG